MKHLYYFFLILISSMGVNKIHAQQMVLDTILPLNITHWQNYDCGDVSEIGDTLRVTGYDYRIGGNLFYKDFFNFQNNSEVYIKWRYHSPSWEAVRINLDAIPGHELNTAMISQDTWYFLHISIDATNHTYNYTVSTGNYDDSGGQIQYQWNDNINDKGWQLISSSTIFAGFVDNYAGTDAYLDLAEVRLKNVIPVNNDNDIISEEIYDFEDGQIPNIIHPLDSNNWTIDATNGFNSNKSLFSEAPENVSHSAYMDLEHLVKIEFDVKTSSNTHKSIGFVIDSIAGIAFSKASSGCWKHLVWRFNDDLPHRLYWRINGTIYDDSPGKIWIDNLKISYRQPTAIAENLAEDIVVYPNPAKDYIAIKIPQNKDYQFKLYDTSGRILKTGNLHYTNQKIALSNLRKGIYLLQLQNGDQPVFTKKIILQ